MAEDSILRTYKGLAFAVAAVLVMGAGYWMLSPGGGPEEFAKAMKALGEAKSWRIAYSGRASGGIKVELKAEVSCPEVHLIRRVIDEVGGTTLKYQEFYVRGEQDWLYRETADEDWRKVEDLWELEHLCAQAKGGGGDPRFMPSFDTLLRGRSNLEKGDRKTVSGVPCRVWRVNYLLAAEKYQNEDLCIGVKDHLVHERVTQDGTFVYSDWNQEVPMKIPIPVRLFRPSQ